jgi:NAD+ synthase
MLAQLALDLPGLEKLLTSFLENEVHRTGLNNAILGLSGGVDSAVVAYLAARALGPEHVYCVMMPYATSSPDSLADAQTVVDALGVHAERCDITPMVDPLFAAEPDMDKVRRGNIMARTRMIVLYDRSARDRGLVIGTGNKTEILLGYSTLHGDSACAINPLGDLYKSQVWKLARHLGVPPKIVEKAPSADLWMGQTDEGELGFSYKRVDELLAFLVDERRTRAELIDLGFEEHFIAKVSRMIERNQFKRMPPIIAKVGQRTVNADFRYPRDWGT